MQPRESARDLATGRWRGILGQYLDERALSGKHTACPMCGGRDRFRLDDKDGAGTWICSNCGAGDGFHLLEKLNGWTFAEAAKHVEATAGKYQPGEVKANRTPESVRAALNRVWESANPLEAGDPVSRYLERRCGKPVAPAGVRCHAGLAYRHDDDTVTKHPALVAQVRAADGRPVCLHRIYLTESGEKADVPVPKKLMTPTVRMENVAVRLMAPAGGWLGVAEGIETALCASIIHGVPVWACVSAGLLKTFRPPECVRALYVFGDNDETFTGQAAAYELARAVAMAGVETSVLIPGRVGSDWADR